MSRPDQHDDGRQAPDPVGDVLASYLETGALPLDAMAELDAQQQAEVRATMAALDPVRAELAQGAVWHEPPASLEGKILDAVLAAASGAGTGDVHVVSEPGLASPSRPAAVPAGPSIAPAGASVTSLEDRLERTERSEHRFRFLAVAASFVAILAAVAAIASVATRSEPLAAPPIATTVAPSTVASTTSSTDPDVDVSRPLVAAPAFAGVTGEIKLKQTGSGLRIYFDADNLPGCDHGKIYEAWVKTMAGTDVSVGTFHGGEDVTLWAGVDLPEVKGFWVSLQDEGNHVPSDQRIVSASLAS